jgi:protein tyrosine/serine phosphatase
MTRHISLDGVDNLRDFGGYRTAAGGQLRTGLLYRSAAHHQASDADLKALSALGLELIVDLRREVEREASPSRRWPGFRAEVLTGDLPDAYGGWEEMLRDRDPTAELFHAESVAWYRTAPWNDRLVDLYRRYFAALGEGRGPVLIHCAVGKDRTGLLAAFTHALAGVHEDDVMSDYLMTNEMQSLQRRAPWVAERIRKLSGRAPNDEAVRASMTVQPYYLQAALDAIHDRHGSVPAYLEAVLGVDATRRAGFERRYLQEDGDAG